MYAPGGGREHARAVHVNAHRDVVGERRLLAVAGDEAIRGLDDAEIDVYVFAVRRYGERRLALAVVIDERAVLELGQHVAVDHEKVSLEIRYDGEDPAVPDARSSQ